MNQALRARFEFKPEDAAAFAALEEAHFVAGEWSELAALYERRLSAADLTADKQPKQRARVLQRLAQTREERLGDGEAAINAYREAAALDPTLRPAITQLRRLLSARGDWDAALALADTESKLPMRPSERAQLASELGALFLDKRGDAAQARTYYERALAAEANYAPALLGLANAAERTGDLSTAAASLEQAAHGLRGAERGAALARLANLQQQLGEASRASETFRKALTDDPSQASALSALAARAEANQQWGAFDELQDRRFALSKDRLEKLAIAHDAGRVQLERANNPQTARVWFRRALDLFPDDPVVHLYLSDVERALGNTDALAKHLKRATQLAKDAAPVEALRESAQLESARGAADVAIDQLRRALARDPSRSDVATQLADALAAAGREDEFVELLEAQLSERPGGEREVALWVRLGAFHEEQRGEFSTALDAYAQALDISHAHAAAIAGFERVARKLERWDSLGERLRAAAQAAPGTAAAQLWVRLGDLGLEREDLDGAAGAYAAALAADPADRRARQGVERIALATGDDEAILVTFEREAEETSDRERIAFLVGELARIHEERGNPARALHWVLRLAAVRPEDAAVLAHAARLQSALADRAGELATLRDLDARISGEPQLVNRRRIAALSQQLGEPATALAAHRAVLALRPEELASARAVVALVENGADLEAHVAALRHLASIASGDERTAREYELACLLMDRVGDLHAAGAVLEGVVDAPNAPHDAEARFAEVLGQIGRWDALCGRLDLRRRLLDPLDPRALELDLQRAELLVDRLSRSADAAAICEAVLDANPRLELARDVLERALRKLGDDARLVKLLSERSALAKDREQRALLEMERALLLEERLRALPEARAVLGEIASSGSALAGEAERRLRAMLENAQDWRGLAEHLETSLGSGDAHADAAVHTQIALIARDRMRDLTRAIAHVESALALTPNDLALHRLLQSTLESAGGDGELCVAYERELALGGADASRRRLLHGRCAELLERSGDLERAESHHAALVADGVAAGRSMHFLAERYEQSGRLPQLAALLRQRIEQLASDPAGATTVRLQLAQLEAGPLCEPDAALATLAPAAASDATLAIVSEPYARLLQRAGHSEALIALARRAAATAQSASERSAWQTRLGDALREAGDLEAAADAYRRALTDRPSDADLQAALRDLYRRQRRSEPLARLLEVELARTTGPLEIPLRLELGELLTGPLNDPAAALIHYRRALELEPKNADTLARAIAVAERANVPDVYAELLGRAAGTSGDPQRRARLLTRRAALLAGPLARVEEAIACYEAALALAPDAPETLAALRGIFEDRAEWPRALACFERELAATPTTASAARISIIQEAVRFASEMLGSEAALPWLERLRAAKPGDVEPLARIAHAHRSAGRADSLLRALEAQLEVSPEPRRRAELSLEAAQLLCERMHAPARAAALLEAARVDAPADGSVLAMLDALYVELDRPRDRLGVVKARIDLAAPDARLSLRGAASSLARRLGDRAESAAQLWCALGECGAASRDRSDLLRALAEDLAEHPDLWARASEAELAALDRSNPVFAERRRPLRQALAERYAASLAADDAAIAHLCELLDRELPASDASLAGARERASALLLELYRRGGEPVQLAHRLADHLKAFPAARPEPWLELARLRLDVLHQPGLAATAFEAALARDERSLPALRGLRSADELLGRWADVASTLERELAIRADASPGERAALLRRIGEIRWKRLDETTKASRAYASALEADPADLTALRALQQLFEAMEDWRGALDLYESEISVLASAEPERRRACWLRAAEIAHRSTRELQRALRCFDAAAQLQPLETPRLAELADVLDRLGERDRFVASFAAWIDSPDSQALADDELRLAAAYEGLQRYDGALARAERAAEKAPSLAAAWDRIAGLRERLGMRDGAADALARAAALVGGSEAAQRRVRAADLLPQDTAPERRMALLEDATRDDPVCAEAFARLALAAQASGDLANVESAAERASGLHAQGAALPDSLRRDASLAGARAALALDRLTPAARLLGEVLAIEPNHAEALAQHGRTLLRIGDVEGARRSLTRALEHSQAAGDRAPLLALLGNAEAAARASEAALVHYREALSLDPAQADAHAGLVQVLLRERRDVDAIAALLAWAQCANAPRDRARRLLQAAELELNRPQRDGAAEALLREATNADASLSEAWALLAELLAKEARWSELVDAASAGALAATEPLLRSRLAALRGRALEQRGDLRAAADAIAEAAQTSPRASEAALSSARLYRGLGDWIAAAEVLRSFAARAPEDARGPRAMALHQLGRLLAGPLEDVDSAIAAYREAAALGGDSREAREALADLLLHRQAHWDEAIAQHGALLAQDPGRLASLRGLLRIARGRGNASASAHGLTLLRALGVATAEESREAPTRGPLALAARPALADSRFELARKLALEAKDELAEALGGARAAAAPPSGDPSARFRGALTRVEGELSAPALVPLTTADLASTLQLLADLGSELETVSAQSSLVNTLSKALGWRAKKRIRRVLEARSGDELTAIDFAAWRSALRGLAGAVLVDRGEVSLRDAFVAWIQADDPDASRTLPPEADLRARVAAHAEARELLRLAVNAWLAGL